MTNAEFFVVMEPLAELFGKDLKPESKKHYFDKVSSVSAKAFRSVVQTLMDNCQRFPTRAEMVRACSEQNAWNTDREAAPMELRRPPVMFDCVCGHSFSMIADDVEKGEGSVECVGVFYDQCNRTYPVELLRRLRIIAVKGEAVRVGFAPEII